MECHTISKTHNNDMFICIVEAYVKAKKLWIIYSTTNNEKLTHQYTKLYLQIIFTSFTNLYM
jgi:hypothetical protein